jgi:hypothetical protein
MNNAVINEAAEVKVIATDIVTLKDGKVFIEVKELSDGLFYGQRQLSGPVDDLKIFLADEILAVEPQGLPCTICGQDSYFHNEAICQEEYESL